MKPELRSVTPKSGHFPKKRPFAGIGLTLLVVLLGWLGAPQLRAQADTSFSMGMINIAYTGSIPGGDMADRFGFTSLIGGEAGYKFSNNFYFYGGARFMFGNHIKDTIAGNITEQIGDSSSGFVTMAIGSDGRYYEVRMFQRGFVVPVMFGKIFPLGGSPTNSGIYVEAGAQFFQHKVRIEAIGNSVPQLSKQYLPGYDRLTNGIGAVQGVGYRYYGRNRLVNFFAGFEFSENFTRSRRSINYDTGIADTANRTDFLWGFKVGWTFPLYSTATRTLYFY